MEDIALYSSICFLNMKGNPVKFFHNNQSKNNWESYARFLLNHHPRFLLNYHNWFFNYLHSIHKLSNDVSVFVIKFDVPRFISSPFSYILVSLNWSEGRTTYHQRREGDCEEKTSSQNPHEEKTFTTWSVQNKKEKGSMLCETLWLVATSFKGFTIQR